MESDENTRSVEGRKPFAPDDSIDDPPGTEGGDLASISKADPGKKTPDDALLSVTDLSFSHPGGPEVFKSLDLSVGPGETVVIMGGSGVGKSTLAELIFSLSPKARFTGKIQIDQDRAALVLQEGAVFEHLNVGENLALVLRSRGQKPSASVLKEALSQVKLGDKHLTQRSDHLSSGEKRRLALARALCAQPELIYCDEPSAGLDLDNVTELGKLLRSLVRTQRRAAVVVTHDPLLAALTADRVLLMEKGRLSPLVDWTGSPEELDDGQVVARCSQLEELCRGRLAKVREIDEPVEAVAGPPVSPLSSRLVGRLASVGDYALHTLTAVASLPTSLRHPRDFLLVFGRAFNLSGLSGIPFFFLVGAILGATFIMVILGASILPARVTLEKVQAVPLTAMAPPLMGFLFAARSGSAIASWLGSMSHSRQVDALLTLKIPPNSYLRAPVFLAMVLAFVVLGLFFYGAMWAGAFVMCRYKVGILDPVSVLNPFANEQITFHAIIKAPLYALLTAAVTAHVGLLRKRTAEDVAMGITRVIIICTVLVVLFELYFAGIIIAGGEG